MSVRRPFVLAALLAAVVTLPSAAQGNPECSAYQAVPRAFNTCNAAIDGTRAFHPIAGLLITGGNPVLADFGSLGGLGHAKVTIRGNAARVILPSLSYDGTSATVPPGDSIFVPIPAVEAAIGLIGGKGRSLGVDFLGSATLLPTSAVDNLTVEDGARSIGSVALGLGYGVRVGVLDDRGVTPGFSVSVMRRELPRLTYGTLATDDYVYDVQVKTTSVRAEVGKSFSLVSVGAGVGYDWYRGDANVIFRNPVTTLPEPPIAIDLNNNRGLIYGNAGLNLGPARLVAELGYQLGKDQQLTTDFQGFDTTKGKVFFSGGLQLGL